MKYSNLISTSIPEEDLKEIRDAIQFIDKKMPELVTLTREEKASLPKMKSNTIDFVHECLKMAKENPEIVPKNVNIPEIVKDVELVEAAHKILEPLRGLMKRIEDSILLAESEAYLPSLAIYNAARLNNIERKRKEKKTMET